MSYEWIKVVHLLALISWMAGLFYLPRLFVYHADRSTGSETDGIFKMMERRLMKAIMRPAAVVTIVSGVLLVGLTGAPWGSTWLVAKLTGVGGLLAFHGVLEMHLRQFAGGMRHRSGRYFRIINEIPTVLLIWIVIWVVIKPLS